jgi:long-chain acyl-CoA synthetase
VTANLAGLLAAAADRDPGRVALYDGDAAITYAELDRLAARTAGLLRARGVGPGDRVALLLPNSAAFVASYHGALRLGAEVVPLNVVLRDVEVAARLESCTPRVVLTTAGRTRALESVTRPGTAEPVDPAAAAECEPESEIAEVAAPATAVLLFTSGTTGDARAAELTHAGLRANATVLAGAVLALRPDDVLLGAAPLTHVFGQSGVMNAAIAAGAAVALMPRFTAEGALDLMRATRTTVFLGVPTMCIALLEARATGAAPPPLRQAHTGGAPLDPAALAAFESAFGCPVLEGYGMTETAGVVVSHQAGMARKAGSVGTPVPGVALRLVDRSGGDVGPGEIGEVLVRTPSLMRGYRGVPADGRTPEGWFATGDLGRLDADGYLFLVDRLKDTILRAGYTVYPRDVEEVMLGHPDVAEAVALGVPDPRVGEEVVVCCVLRPGAAASGEELREFARERLAGYRYPRLVAVVEALPKGPSGKIVRRAIDREGLARALRR